MQVLIPALVFASVGTLVFVVLGVVFSEERQVTQALRTVSTWEAEQASEAEPLLRPFRHRVIRPMTQSVGDRLRRMVPANSCERMQRKLEAAGRPYGMTPEGVMSMRIVGSVAGLVIVVLLGALLHARLSVLVVLVALAGACAGYLAPDMWIDGLRKARQASMRRALPDMLDMLTISVQAGLGFDMALVKLIQNTRGPLAEEFGRMLSEVQAGVSRRDALRHMGDRTDVPELDNFITAMVQADVFGVSVSGILAAQSQELRKKRRQFVEEQAQKAPVKMVFPIIFCMLPATMLVVLGPAIIAIGRTFGVIK
jgi:tight adherence protein C